MATLDVNVTIPDFTGDTGTGGVKGLVPAPAAGDAAANKYLKADGTWATTPGGGNGITELTGDVTAGPGSGSQAATVSNDAVTNAKLANMAEATVKGRQAGSGTGDPEDLTASQARTAMGLGSLATQSGTFSGTSSGTNTGDQDLSGLMVKANNLSDLASASTARTNLGLGTNALINGAPSYITYSGGSQATTSTSFADVHASAAWSGLAPGMYIGEFYILYDAAATTTGARFGLNGTVTQDYLTIFLGYSTLAGDRSSAQTGTFDGGAAAPSSTVTSGNSAVVQFTINVTVTGDIVLRFSTEVGGSAITVTSVIGFIRRVA